MKFRCPSISSIARLSLALALVVGFAFRDVNLAQAATPTPAQRAQAKSVEAALRKAGKLYRSKKYDAASEALGTAQAGLAELTADDSREITALAAPLRKQLTKARELLQAEGVELPPPADSAMDDKAEMPAAKSGKSGKPAKADSPTGEVSFTKQIAPMLVAKCGGCHIQRSRGEFNMSTYVSLSRGGAGGSVIVAGDTAASRIVELVESGDMPRGGGKVSKTEKSQLSAWIKAGAKFDGPDAGAPLTSFAPGDQPGMLAQPKIDLVQATGKEEVQFLRDLGPVLLTHCIECHGELNPRSNFAVLSFNRLLQGGDNGLVFDLEQPADSLLIKKLRGTATGDRMPQGRDPLPEETIAKIEKWISQQARFDGVDPAMQLDQAIAEYAAVRLTHEELAKRRLELAEKNWRLILPDNQPQAKETNQVLVYGSGGAEKLAAVAQTADEHAEKLVKLFKLPSGQPLLKGRLTLYVFDKRYDYGEVGTMLEHRELPAVWRGHWSFNPLHAYGCLLLSDNGEAGTGLVTQQLAGAYLGSLGRVPRWFSEGSARALAAKFDPKDPRVKQWDDQLPRILLSVDKPDAFLMGNLPPEDADILSYSFAKHLMLSGTRYSALVTALQQATPFDAAFGKAYGVSPLEIVPVWAAKASKRGR